MKILLQSLLLLLLFNYLHSQSITNIEIKPPSPTIDDDIQIIVEAYFYFGGGGLCNMNTSYNIDLQNSIFNIDIFYDISGTWQINQCYQFDSIVLDYNLSEGSYAIICNLHTIFYEDTIQPADTIFNYDSDTIYFSVISAGILNSYLNNNSIKIYPIPANNNLILEYREEIIIKNIKLYSIDGKLIKSFSGSDKLLNVSDIPKGQYLLHIYLSDNIIKKKKIIVI